jgi:hypothetical protein
MINHNQILGHVLRYPADFNLFAIKKTLIQHFSLTVCPEQRLIYANYFVCFVKTYILKSLTTLQNILNIKIHSTYFKCVTS